MASNTQLLHCLRNTVQKANVTEDQTERETLLGSVDQILNTILLRHDINFYVEHYQAGYQLALKGEALLADSTGILSFSDIPTELNPDYSPDVHEQHIELISGILTQIVNLLPSTGTNDLCHFLKAVVNWETTLYAKRLETAPTPQQKIVPEARIEKADFEAYLRNKFPAWTDLKITRFTNVPGGFSKSTILVETEDALNGSQSMVIRAMQATNICKLYAYEIINEYPIVNMAFEAGVPVAEPLWLEDDKALLGTQFMVSKRALGTNSGTALGPTEAITESMMQNLVETMVKVHSVDLNQHQHAIKHSVVLNQWDQYNTVAECNHERNKYWMKIAEEAGALSSPLIARAFRWLEDNIEAADEKPTLLHGDYGLHNILIDNDKVTALLDWETAHIGDPACELSWVYLCTGKQYDPKELIQRYRNAGGRELSEFSFYYQQVFHCIMMPITCVASLNLLNTRLDNIQYANFGLLFMHYNTSHLNAAIELAEAAKKNNGA